MESENKEWLRPKLVAPWQEIVLVLMMTVGWPVVRSAWGAFHGTSTRYMMGLILTDSHMVYYVAFEGALLAALFAIVHWRGWTVADFRIKPDWRSTFQGILLAPFMAITNSVTIAVALVFGFLFQTTFKQFHPFVLSHSQHLLPHSIHLGWWSLILAMTLNAFYEEIAFMGYAFNQFAAKRGTTFALVVTVLLRMSFHSYQGPFHVLGIGAVFFLTSLAYCRTRNLWPLILAHIIVDVGIVGFVKIWYG